MFPYLFDMGEESPPILPGKAVKAEEAHHPLKSSGEAGRLIEDYSPVGQPKFQWNRSVEFQTPFWIERTKDPPRLMVTSHNNRGGLGCVGPESIEPVGMIEQGDLVVLLIKMVRSGETGQACAENENGLRGWSGHENRDRIQIRMAIITR